MVPYHGLLRAKKVTPMVQLSIMNSRSKAVFWVNWSRVESDDVR